MLIWKLIGHVDLITCSNTQVIPEKLNHIQVFHNPDTIKTIYIQKYFKFIVSNVKKLFVCQYFLPYIIKMHVGIELIWVELTVWHEEGNFFSL